MGSRHLKQQQFPGFLMAILELRRSVLPNAEALLPYIQEIDQNRWYSNRGPLLQRFETLLSSHFGVEPDELVTVSNATVGLQLSMAARFLARESSMRSNYQCILPAFGFAASVVAAERAGVRPVFSDVDPGHWTVTPDLVRASTLSASETCVMPISPFGVPIDPKPWEALENEMGIGVVIDAAWCFDSVVPSAIPTVVSLHATKVFGIGEGGVVISKNRELISKIRQMTNFGFDADRMSALPGSTNAKLSEYSAAIGLAALDLWPCTRERALWLSAVYREYMGTLLHRDFSGTWAPGAIAVKLSGAAAVEDAMEALRSKGIESRRWWGPILPKMPAFDPVTTVFTQSEALAESVLNLPFHEGVDRDHVRTIASILQQTSGH